MTANFCLKLSYLLCLCIQLELQITKLPRQFDGVFVRGSPVPNLLSIQTSQALNHLCLKILLDLFISELLSTIALYLCLSHKTFFVAFDVGLCVVPQAALLQSLWFIAVF